MPITPITWDDLTNASIDSDGFLLKDGGSDLCADTGTGDAGAWSTETIASGDFKFECTLGPLTGESGRTFVGLTDGSFSLDFADWPYCLHATSEAVSPYPANSVFVYEDGELKTYLEGAWSEGDLLQIICLNGVVRYYLNSRLLYTSSASPSYPLRAIASLACPGTTVNDAQFVSGLDIAPKSGCALFGAVSNRCGSVKVDVNTPTSTLVYNNYPSYPNTYMLWVQLYDNVPDTHPNFTGSSPSGALAAIISNHGGGRFFLGVEEPNTLVFGGQSSNGNFPLDQGPELTIGTWYHLAIVSGAGDPGTRKIYVNGELEIDTTGTSTLIFNMYIGNDNSLRPLPGRLTGLKVWDVALSDEEVAAEYAGCYEPTEQSGNIYSWSKLNGKADSYTDQTGGSSGLSHSSISSSNALPATLQACAECAPPPDGVTTCASEIGDDTGDDCSGPWEIPTPDDFPLPANGGPRPITFQEIEPDWGEHGSKFPDGTPSFNTIQTAQIRRFLVEWDGLSESEAATLDDHWDSARGGLSFTVTHPQTAEVITGVRYEDYDRSPHQRKWSQARTAKLVKHTS